VKNTVKIKKTKIAGMIALLVAAILAIAIFGFSCVGGLVPIGWSGGTVSNGILYIGSLEGRLVSVNVTDLSILRAEPLTYPQQTGLFGCSGATSCVGGASRVPIYGTPVVSEDLVYVAGYNGKIYSYKISNLAQRWIYPREGYLEPFVSGLVLDQNKLFIGCSDGYIYALDATTGDFLGEFKTEDKIWGTPTVADNTIYIGSFDKKLYALSTDDLSLKWTFSTEGSIISQPLVYNGVVYFGAFDRYFYAVNASDGSLKWKFMAESWFWAQPAVVDDMIYAGCLDSSVYVFEAGNGNLVSKLALDSQVASKPVVVDNNIYFATHNGIVYKVSTDDHSYTQIILIESNIDGPLTVHDGIIYIQTSDYALQRIDTSDNSLLPSIPLIIG
jgi:outer membrane protein assembly factor BamB